MSALPAIFSALSDPTRFAIVERLIADGELSAGQIGDQIPISAPAVSRHLSVLHSAGILQRRVNRQQRLYSVRPDAIRQVAEWTFDHRLFWDQALDRIGDMLTAEQENSDG